jgi:hypothetical protein
MRAKSMIGLLVGALSIANAAKFFPVTNRLFSGTQTPTRKKQSQASGGINPGTGGYLSGPGWTAAHVKRMAKKRRNKLRSKRRA